MNKETKGVLGVYLINIDSKGNEYNLYSVDENLIFDGGATSVKDTWTAYVSGCNAVLAEPEDYITLR